MSYVKDFVSYKSTIEELISNKYVGLLLKVGSERCPPCVALDRGPLEQLTEAINSAISSHSLTANKELLVINLNLSKHTNYDQLFDSLKIDRPDSIPAFYLFAYKDNQLSFLREERGYDMQNPTLWKENFKNMVLQRLSEKK